MPVPICMIRSDLRSVPYPVNVCASTSPMAIPVPTVFRMCAAARSSRSHLKCHETSHEDPSSLNVSAASHIRCMKTASDRGVARPGSPRVQ